MFKSIYIRLAFPNLKKNKRSYLPFLVTSIITIMLFFDMSIIMDNSGIKEMPGAGSMRSILGFGTVIVAIFACVFLFYTNSFLIKQRRKEIGLYNVLGMGKKEIAIMMFWESLMVRSWRGPFFRRLATLSAAPFRPCSTVTAYSPPLCRASTAC